VTAGPQKAGRGSFFGRTPVWRLLTPWFRPGSPLLYCRGIPCGPAPFPPQPSHLAAGLSQRSSTVLRLLSFFVRLLSRSFPCSPDSPLGIEHLCRCQGILRSSWARFRIAPFLYSSTFFFKKRLIIVSPPNRRLLRTMQVSPFWQTVTVGLERVLILPSLSTLKSSYSLSRMALDWYLLSTPSPVHCPPLFLMPGIFCFYLFSGRAARSRDTPFKADFTTGRS